jgi:hypothetical protein
MDAAFSRRDFLRLTGVSAAGLGLAGWLGMNSAVVAAARPDDPLRHVVDRTTWGARPQDMERIRQIGAAAWIDEQLAYETIADPLVEQFLASRRVMTMPVGELVQFAAKEYAVVYDTFLWARIFRAAYSERQLYERMVEFWTDHFNIPAPDYLAVKLVDDRDVIRRHALGRFRDLVLGSAQSPAMLAYLDQVVSHRDHPNENYARELMELHTLGVDGGYTEDDVAALARILTGWSLTDDYNHFRWKADMHDDGEKQFLGVFFPAGRGVEEGLEAIDMLVRHPATARFIAGKLCRRFVSDTPPPPLVEAIAQRFVETDGDIREVMRALLNSEAFYSAAGQKFRRPMEAVVAMMRVLSPGLQVHSSSRAVYDLEPLGHLPYHWFPPNGYPDVAGAWMNTNGLLHRWNVALRLALAGDGLYDGATMDIDAVIPQAGTVGELVDAAQERIIGMRLPDHERAMLAALLTRSGDAAHAVDYEMRYRRLPIVLGVLLASPYFQWH